MWHLLALLLEENARLPPQCSSKMFVAVVLSGRSIAAEHVSGIVKRLLILIRYPYSVVSLNFGALVVSATVSTPLYTQRTFT